MKNIGDETIRKYRTWPTQWMIPKTDMPGKQVLLRETYEYIGLVHRQCNGNGKIEWVISINDGQAYKSFEQMNQAADYLYTKWKLEKEEEEARKKTYVVTFEATTSRQYSVQANSFEEAHTKATKKLSTDETVSEVWFHAADVVGMSVTVEGKEIIREKQ